MMGPTLNRRQNNDRKGPTASCTSCTRKLYLWCDRPNKFKNFEESQNFVNKVGNVAEAENHHPDISFGWGYCKVKIFTHAIKGLAESDFILAAKIDKID